MLSNGICFPPVPYHRCCFPSADPVLDVASEVIARRFNTKWGMSYFFSKSCPTKTVGCLLPRNLAHQKIPLVESGMFLPADLLDKPGRCYFWFFDKLRREGRRAQWRPTGSTEKKKDERRGRKGKVEEITFFFETGDYFVGGW
jgi:hypothetical protein